MIKKGTKLYSILYTKCPCCHEGNYFETQNPYNLKKFDKMKSRCEVCGQNFEMETGFYYGAMYVSYGLSVGLAIFIFLSMWLLFKPSASTYLATNALILIILIPVFYRLSRIIWINMFVHFKKK